MHVSTHVISSLTKVTSVVLCFRNHNTLTQIAALEESGIWEIHSSPRCSCRGKQPCLKWLFLCVILQMWCVLFSELRQFLEERRGRADTNPSNVTGHWLCTCRCPEGAHWIMIIVIGNMTKQCSPSYKLDYLRSCGRIWVYVGGDNTCVCAWLFIAVALKEVIGLRISGSCWTVHHWILRLGFLLEYVKANQNLFTFINF